MNFWYDPANATTRSEYIGYFSPVKGVVDLVKADAAAASDKETKDQLNFIASTIEPTEAELGKVHNYKVLDEDEERAWNEQFQDVVTG
ncbi:MAG: hypothetical protein ACXWMG_04875, partial [Candidatus Limnocylindria bacterium]